MLGLDLILLHELLSVPDVDEGFVGGRDDSLVVGAEVERGDEVSVVFEGSGDEFLFGVVEEGDGARAGAHCDKIALVGDLDGGDLGVQIVLEVDLVLGDVDSEELSSL